MRCTARIKHQWDDAENVIGVLYHPPDVPLQSAGKG
jgi:hypothetical protein